MKYYICEGSPDGIYNAAAKARKDVEYILDKLNFKKIHIPTKYGTQTSKLLKIKQLIDYYTNYRIWRKKILKLNKGDILFIQYPLVNTILDFARIINICSKKGIVTIMIIHDLNSLRGYNSVIVKREDKMVLNNASYIIAHNSLMKNKLIEMGNLPEKISELGIFDYITENTIEIKNRKRTDSIIIAGNLCKEKAGYLKFLKQLKEINFNLYGKGYKADEDQNNISYKGAFLPEELLNNLEGSFGLVWDGTSKDNCTGNYGEYMKYNNPHKTSLYLAAGLPMIVWEEAAISKFVLKNKVGFTVKKLEDISNKIKNLSDEEYEQMLNNSKNISFKLRKGYFLNKSLNDIFQKIERKFQ